MQATVSTIEYVTYQSVRSDASVRGQAGLGQDSTDHVCGGLGIAVRHDESGAVGE